MMKQTLLCLATLALVWSCSKPSPADMVRKHRREYEFTFEFIVSTSDLVTIAVDVQNKSGNKNLQDITVILKGFDKDEKVIWEKTEVLDVTGLGNLASKEISIKETIPNASSELEALDISLAPDNPGSGFENYREFMRIAK